MANFINYLKKIQPVYRRSSNAMRIFVAVIIIFGITGLCVLRNAITEMETANAALENQAAQAEQLQTDYREKIDALGTAQSVTDIAQEELGLVFPDTVLIQPTE